MKSSSLSDDDIQRLLDVITTDESIRLPDKKALHHRMINEFRTGLTPETPQPYQQNANDPMVVDLSMEVLNERRQVPWRQICLSSAALVLAVIGVAKLARDASEDTVHTVTDETHPTEIQPIDTPGLLEPGRYSLVSVAGAVEFTTSSNVRVSLLEPGLIVLEPTQGDSAASLSLMSSDISLEEVLEGHREAGKVKLFRTSDMSPNGPIAEYEVRLQPSASTDECEETGACLTIGPVTIESGSIVTVREVLGPDDRRMWALYQSEQYQDPFRREANLIQESLVITADS